MHSLCAKLTVRLTAICFACLSLTRLASLEDSSSSADKTSHVPSVKSASCSVLFVLMCQSQLSPYHKTRCSELRQHLEFQRESVLAAADSAKVTIELADDLVEPGVEVFFYLPILTRNHPAVSSADFVFFCHEETRVDLPRLLELLNGHDASQPLFLGRPLQDHGHYIIHHYSQATHQYPFLYCGFALSRGLIASLASHFHSDRTKLEEYEFRIDPVYELATLISNELHIVNLTAVESMCARPRPQLGGAAGSSAEACVTWVTETFRQPECTEQSSRPSLLSRTLFAVKTHKANFDTVLQALRDTWGKDAPNIRYYADVDDPSIPTIACGVPNTERGHCDKLNRILTLASNETGFDWFVICDDDTVFSVPRLIRLLSCYDFEQGTSSPVVIGEKYGYLSSDGTHGYAYPTGGSGLALNRAVLDKLTGRPGEIRCGSAESPDDMSMGMWLRSLAIPLVHSHLLHQARPVEYAPGLLEAQLPVSFHKHYDIDPRQVYTKWLGGASSAAEEAEATQKSAAESRVEL